MREVSPYPWDALDAQSRASIRAGRAARRRLARAVDPGRLAEALGSVLSAETTLVMRRVRARGRPPSASGARIALEPADGSAELYLHLDSDLAGVVLARALGRPVQLAAPGEPLDPALSGALSALAVEVARRAGTGQPLTVRRGPPTTASGLELDATLLVDGAPYAVSAWVRVPPEPTAEEAIPLHPGRLAQLDVPLCLVVGRALASRAELSGLAPGAAFMPGDGWWIDAAGAGYGALAGPDAESGCKVTFPPEGGIVLRGDTIALGADATMAESDETGVDALGDAALDAPVVVRVELGAVTLSARKWAELAPGDVIETGRRIGEPVVLRIAGRELARGELVNVEGELGVRIRELTGESSG